MISYGMAPRPVPKKKKRNREDQVLTLEGVERIRGELKAQIIGQAEAVDALVDHLMLLCAGFATKATFFFVGPTGVGKTQLARIFGGLYSGNFQVFNCGEYSHGHEMAKLVGSPPGFIGHAEKSFLKGLADKSNKWVFLFDEIEKANPKLYNFLLGLLDTGKVFDSNNEELDFTNSVFIFTSNKGQAELRAECVGFGRGAADAGSPEADRMVVEKSLKAEFSPEFRNRIDQFIHFRSLTKVDAIKIAMLCLDGVPIRPTQQLLEHIVAHSFTREYGARDVQRYIKKEILTKLAKVLLGSRTAEVWPGKLDCTIKDGFIEIVDNRAKKTRRTF